MTGKLTINLRIAITITFRRAARCHWRAWHFRHGRKQPGAARGVRRTFRVGGGAWQVGHGYVAGALRARLGNEQSAFAATKRATGTRAHVARRIGYLVAQFPRSAEDARTATPHRRPRRKAYRRAAPRHRPADRRNPHRRRELDGRDARESANRFVRRDEREPGRIGGLSEPAGRRRQRALRRALSWFVECEHRQRADRSHSRIFQLAHVAPRDHGPAARRASPVRCDCRRRTDDARRDSFERRNGDIAARTRVDAGQAVRDGDERACRIR